VGAQLRRAAFGDRPWPGPGLRWVGWNFSMLLKKARLRPGSRITWARMTPRASSYFHKVELTNLNHDHWQQTDLELAVSACARTPPPVQKKRNGGETDTVRPQRDRLTSGSLALRRSTLRLGDRRARNRRAEARPYSHRSCARPRIRQGAVHACACARTGVSAHNTPVEPSAAQCNRYAKPLWRERACL
jgi:hypothetical protein